MKFPAVATNVPLLEFAGIDTDAGTVKLPVEVSGTMAPVTMAETTAVQVVEPLGLRLVEAQVMPVSVGVATVPTTTLPPVAVIDKELPSVAAAMTLLTVTTDVLAEVVRVNDTAAIAPFEKLVFPPAATQIYPATSPVQVMLFPAACAAADGKTVKVEKLASGALSVNWIAAGVVPEAVDSERFIETILPGVAVTDDKVNEDCAINGMLNSITADKNGMRRKCVIVLNDMNTPRTP